MKPTAEPLSMVPVKLCQVADPPVEFPPTCEHSKVGLAESLRNP